METWFEGEKLYLWPLLINGAEFIIERGHRFRSCVINLKRSFQCLITIHINLRSKFNVKKKKKHKLIQNYIVQKPIIQP